MINKETSDRIGDYPDGAIEEKEDFIARPKHYNWLPNGIESKDVTSFLGRNAGAACDYIIRHRHKNPDNPAEDLKKAIQHL